MANVCDGCECKENCSFHAAFPDTQKSDCNARASYDELVEKNKK